MAKPFHFAQAGCSYFAVGMYLISGSLSLDFDSAVVSPRRSPGTRALTSLSFSPPHMMTSWLAYVHMGVFPLFCVSSVLRFLHDSARQLLEESAQSVAVSEQGRLLVKLRAAVCFGRAQFMLLCKHHAEAMEMSTHRTVSQVL